MYIYNVCMLKEDTQLILKINPTLELVTTIKISFGESFLYNMCTRSNKL